MGFQTSSTSSSVLGLKNGKLDVRLRGRGNVLEARSGELAGAAKIVIFAFIDSGRDGQGARRVLATRG